jgi:hypothetical protein
LLAHGVNDGGSADDRGADLDPDHDGQDLSENGPISPKSCQAFSHTHFGTYPFALWNLKQVPCEHAGLELIRSCRPVDLATQFLE